MKNGDRYVIGAYVMEWQGEWITICPATKEDRMTYKRLTDFCHGENLR